MLPRQSASEVSPLRIEFRVAVGEVWKDPRGVAWRVTDTDSLGAGITLERTLVEVVRDPHEFAQTWRKVEG